MSEPTLVHATCVAIGERGVLLMGPPGSGKSDLALRLIDMPGRGIGDAEMTTQLVSDDQVAVTREEDALFAAPPEAIAGRLEMRGFGIVTVAYAARVRLHLAVGLKPAVMIERLPEPQRFELLGLSLPMTVIDAAAASAAARVRSALLGL